jgi:Na+-transporting NADH:ubiquinone oxidoreductase subunit A
MITIKRGLNLPINGAPVQKISPGPDIDRVALLGPDYVGMKPTMLVKEGDQVKLGQALFEDKKTPGVRYTAPASGQVTVINRGVKRALLSVVIAVNDDEPVQFNQYNLDQLSELSTEQVQTELLNSGLWTSLRTRPFSKVPQPGTRPAAIFVNFMDTRPLAGDPELIVTPRLQDLQAGLTLLTRLTQGDVVICRRPDSQLELPDIERVKSAYFAGPHPAGLPGTHIHFINPVSVKTQVWTIDAQEVVAMGKLFTTGQLDTGRVVALAGPQVKQPRLVQTQLGASTDELCQNQLEPEENRVISGCVLAGRRAAGPLAFLGRYHQQISVIKEGREQELLGYLSPGKHKYSILNTFLSALDRRRTFAFSSSTQGSPRAMVPVGNYERVMPLDILPTQLLRALIVGDTDTAQKLGCLELAEEDLGLCTFVCPGKYEYGPLLRDSLTLIEKEG